MRLASFVLMGLIRHMIYEKEFISSTEQNCTNLNTNKCNKTPMTDITRKPINSALPFCTHQPNEECIYTVKRRSHLSCELSCTHSKLNVISYTKKMIRTEAKISKQSNNQENFYKVTSFDYTKLVLW